MFLIYSFLYSLVTAFLFLPEYLKRPPAVRTLWTREKMGLLDLRDKNNAGLIWVHAVSVGEVNASIALLKKIRESYDELGLVLSTVTDTGRKVALKNVPGGTKVVYLPFDVGILLRRCFGKLDLKAFITIETEFWPNIFRALRKKDVPVLVLNGRVSDKSAKGYDKISFFMRKVLDNVSAFGVQSRTDADRLRRIGADPKRIKVIGNFKFDTNIRGAMPTWTRALKSGPVIVAGSTHKGEEEIMLSAYMGNLPNFPGLKMVLAPRHPERFREVEELLRNEGIPFLKRSEFGDGEPEEIRGNRVILLDAMGELPRIYGIADLAIIGKSFTAVGGQNPLEPAYWGKAIICGIHMENFQFMKDFYDAGAAFEVMPDTIAKKVKELLLAPEKARAAGERARELCMRNSGAVEKAMKIIEEVIDEKKN